VLRKSGAAKVGQALSHANPDGGRFFLGFLRVMQFSQAAAEATEIAGNMPDSFVPWPGQFNLSGIALP
jgi:hypothetical protein